jgi:predicted nucleic acid-binding protein
MSADRAYVESSAFVKLIGPENESTSLRTYLREWPQTVSSALLHVEALRAARKWGPAAVAAARHRLGVIELITVDEAVLEGAATIGPELLRSLDAIHLVTAVRLGDDLGVIVTYDRRLAAAAGQLGLPVASPA